MSARIRLAAATDAAQVLAIYAPFCRDTPVTFELEPPSEVEMVRRILGTLEHWPWIVVEDHGEVAGYAYATRFRERLAYRWTVEVTVYVQAGYRREGVGRGLYASLLGLCTLQGYVNAIAAITLPNEPSVGLHRALGFREVGIYRHVGYKCGAWHDVGLWQQMLRAPEEDPPEPRSMAVARELQTWDGALEDGLRFIRL